MPIDFERTRDCLKQFDFQRLFIEELGWSQPASRSAVSFAVKEDRFTRKQIAGLAGAVVFQVGADDGKIPDAKTRGSIHKEIVKSHHENLLIFVDGDRAQSLWYWVKRQDGKSSPREHLYARGQPGDLFLSKLGQMVFDLAEFDAEGNVSIVEVASRLKAALDVERVTKRFYGEFQEQHVEFLELIKGIRDERQRRWYASVLLNRLMFIYFLQRKGFLDRGELNYLQNKLQASKEKGKNQFFSGFLKLLFFEGFAKPDEKRSAEARRELGEIRYLNGGLFLPHKVEQQNPNLDVPDRAFENLFALFEKYSWNLDDTPGGKDDEINPDVLGYIFEKYINQKAFGAYYTRTEITEYLSERTIHRLILDAVNTPESVRKDPPVGLQVHHYEALGDLLIDLDAGLCKRLLFQILPGLSLLDPACGSGAFLVAAMKTLINVYAAVVGKVKFLKNKELTAWLDKIEREHPSISYFIKKSIITDNLYGVDIMEEATEIARLRLFLALVASAESVHQLEPLPNIDFNILPGNSLIGLLRVRDEDFEKKHQKDLFRKSYKQLLAEKNRMIEHYRHAAAFAEDLTALRDDIDKKKAEARETLDEILLDEFTSLGIKFEQATWDTQRNKEGKPTKRPLKQSDIQELAAFHWGFEFDDIINTRGGFDAIITNPPWETFQPDAKEFFQEYSDFVSKKKMDLRTFETEQAGLLKDQDVMSAWLEYHSRFNHLRNYFRTAPQYSNQVPIIDGKRHGKDINLYKLFLEQCVHLLRRGGECGIVIPSGIYTDLGAKKLREMLFSETRITGMCGFENRKEIFEGVHRSYKFVVLTFEKGQPTESFPAAFMRLDVTELDHFPRDGALEIPIALIRRLSPDSLSVTEFKQNIDIRIAKNTLRFPLLREHRDGPWNVELHREFNMTDDAHLFQTAKKPGRLALFEGKMIHQFTHEFAEPRYWVSEREGRKELLGARQNDSETVLSYERYRIGFRDIARSTDERTMIATVIPARVFTGNTLNISTAPTAAFDLTFIVALLNSFTVDYQIRQKVSAHCNMFYVYQLPLPRLSSSDPAAVSIVNRAARLVSITPDFDQYGSEIGLKGHGDGVTDHAERARLRAELDGLIANLYGLTEQEFSHVLSTFPLVPDPVKVAAQNAYRDVERGLIK